MKTKRYLSGIDWAVNGLDYVSRRNSGVGNISQIVLEVQGELDVNELRNSLIKFVNKFPILFGRVGRDYNLAPYWKYQPKSESDFALNLKAFKIIQEKSNPGILDFLAQRLNEPFLGPCEHFVFRLFIKDNKTFLGFTFDHRLFDAYGAEAFLNMLGQDWASQGELFKGINFTEAVHLDHWKEKFLAGQKVNREFLKLANHRPLMNLPVAKVIYKNKFRFKAAYFNEKESNQIIDSAYKKCGYLLISPFVLANSLEALQAIFRKKCKISGDYLVPVSMDMRSQPARVEDVFFNHLSFLFFRLPDDALQGLLPAFELIKNQMYEQIKLGIPRALCEASLLMRIAPLSALDFFTALLLRKQGASLGFSYIGETKFESPDFFGKKVLNLFHMPRVPIPPGLGIFFNQFQDRINVVFSYLEGIIAETEAVDVVNKLKDNLLA